jgi:DNA-binding transcriptional MocR family regulator
VREPIPHHWPVVAASGSDGGPDLVALLGTWAREGHGSLSRRLAHRVRHLIEGGVLPGGWQLPPERHLATRLGTSRTTVTLALDELRAEGLLYSRQGSGTYVAGPGTTAPYGTRIAEHLLSGPGIDLAKGDAPDLSHLPAVSLEMWQLNASCGGAAVNTAGLPAMRQAIADLYGAGGTTGRPRPTEPRQVHVTAGSHQATHLLVAALAAPGQAVALAELSYAGLFDILDSLGVRPLAVRLDRGGMDPAHLEHVLVHEKPALLYHQAGPQIPTGQVESVARTRAIAATLDRHPVPVIEDTTLAAMSFAGVAPMLADHCKVATVHSTGSLSKTCWAGIRIGWMRGPAPFVEQTVYRHLSDDLGPSVPSQLLALQLLPHLDEIAVLRRRALEESVDAALAQLGRVLPEVVVAKPDGGSILWLRFPVEDTTALVSLAHTYDVRLAPDSIHTVSRRPGAFIRIDVDRARPLVQEGIERLATAWRAHG